MAELSHVDGGADSAIARLASAQCGLVTRRQLEAIGLGRGAIGHRLAQDRLHALHRGVYLVGHPVPPPLARELAAVLACGPAAVISHRSAAGLWRLSPAPDDQVDITVVGRARTRRASLRIHRARRLDPQDVTKRRQLPITAVPRTLLDLAEVVGDRELERALDEAQTQRLASRDQLLAMLRRTPGRRGAAPLGALLDREGGPALTRSQAEERLLALVRNARLPSPEVNVRVGGHEVDFLWRSEGLVVEVDGFRFHSTRAAFERDRLRDAELLLIGFHVIRVTWRQLLQEPEAVVARIAQALVQPIRSTPP